VLLRDPFVLIARRGHPLVAQSPSIEAYAALDHVLVSPRGDTSGAVDRALADFGLKRRIALLVATYLALPAVLMVSDLVATVPQRTARQIAAIAEIEMTPLPSTSPCPCRWPGTAVPQASRRNSGPLAADPSRECLIGHPDDCLAQAAPLFARLPETDTGHPGRHRCDASLFAARLSTRDE